ncbi:MAG: hypothetical protein AB8I08_01715 [Sandaracinaceae bacterium]
MTPTTTRLASITLVMAVVLFGAPTPGEACGPPPPPFQPMCTNVFTFSTAARVPLNHAYHPIVAAVIEEHGEFSAPPEGWTESLVLERETDAGWASVEFRLETTSPDEYQLVITDPVPGLHVLSSPDDTCDTEIAPSGAGTLVTQFELLPEAEIPTALGAAPTVTSELVSADVQTGSDGRCEPVLVSVVDQVTTVDLPLDEVMRPWTDLARFEMLIDGELVNRYSAQPALGEDLVVSLTYAHRCEASDESVSLGVLDEGIHQVQVRGVIRGSDEDLVYLSESVDMIISCEEGVDSPTTDADTATVSSRGCSAAPVRSDDSGFGLLALPLLAVFALRRRRDWLQASPRSDICED